MSKKLIGLGFIVSVAAALLMGGCKGSGEQTASKLDGNMYLEGLPIVKEQVTLNVSVQRYQHLGAFKDMPLLQELEKKTNVKINWIEMPTDSFTEKSNLMFASGNFPDIMLKAVTKKQILEYGATGSIIPLDDLIEKYAPNWVNALEKVPQARKVATAPDGKIYSLPLIRLEPWEHGFRDALFINKQWLDKVGAKMPEDVNEFYNVLKAFKEKDPNENGVNDEIPWSFIYNGVANGQFDMYSFFGLIESPDHLYIKDGKVVLSLLEEQNKNVIRFLNKMYQDNLIDKESFTQNTTQLRAKTNSEPTIIGFFTSYNGGVEAQSKIDAGVYVPMPALKGPNGERPLMRTQMNNVESGLFTIFKNNKYPEISMRWANELADGDFGLRALYDPLEINGEGKYQQKQRGSEETLFMCPSTTMPIYVDSNMFDKLVPPESIVGRKALYDVYKDYVCDKDMMFPSMYYSDEQNKVISKYWNDIKEYIKKTQAKWITAGGMDSEWDGFVAQLEKLHIDEVIQVHQEAYDIYANN